MEYALRMQKEDCAVRFKGLILQIFWDGVIYIHIYIYIYI